MLRWFRRWYCRMFHTGILYVGGKAYICRRCGRVWKTPW